MDAPSGGSWTVECQRREDRGAKAPRGCSVGKEFPALTDKGSKRGLYPSTEILLTSEWKMVHFGALWMLFLQTNFLPIVPLNL